MTLTEEITEQRKRIAALTGLLSRLASECGIEHGGKDFEQNVAAYCDSRRQQRAVDAMACAKENL